MFVNWILYPLLMVVACTGHGLLVARLAGLRTGVLLIPLGLASMVLCTMALIHTGLHGSPWLGIVVPAVAGWAVGGRRLLADLPARRSEALLPGTAGLLAFVAYGAPVLALWELSYSGYTHIVDVAHHFTYTDWLLDHGYDEPRSVNSSHEKVAKALTSSGYPLGFNAVLGAGGLLVGREIAWLYQPTMALGAIAAALAAFYLLARLGLSRPLATVGAVVAAQPTLLYAYGIGGGFKELYAYAMILGCAAVLAQARGVRQLALAAVPAAAGVALFDLTIAPWLAVLLAVAIAVRGAESLLRRRRAGWSLPRWAVVPGAAAAVIVGFVGLRYALGVEVPDVVTAQGEVGNLAEPLEPWAWAGVWLSGDYRFPLSREGATHALIVMVLAFAALGVVWSLVRRQGSLIALACAAAVTVLVVLPATGPWIDVKVSAIDGGLVVLLAFAGVAALEQRVHRLAAWVGAAAVTLAVLAGNGLAYHSTTMAPYDRLHEEELIGKRFAGQGRALVPAFGETAEYFLRDILANGRINPVGDVWLARDLHGSDIADVDRNFLQNYPLLVLRRAPDRSRPPANYELAYRGTYHDVWRQVRPPETILAHEGVPLYGTQRQSGRFCQELEAMFDERRAEGGRPVWGETPNPIVLLPGDLGAPEQWPLDGSRGVQMRGPGFVEGTFTAPRAGRYRVWARGTFQRPVHFYIDDRLVASAAYEADYTGESVPLETVELTEGVHRLRILRRGGSLAPGSGDESRNRRLHAVFLVNEDDPPARLLESSWADFQDICRSHRVLRWVEIVR